MGRITQTWNSAPATTDSAFLGIRFNRESSATSWPFCVTVALRAADNRHLVSFVSLSKWIKIKASVIKDVFIQCITPYILYGSGQTTSMYRTGFESVIRVSERCNILPGSGLHKWVTFECVIWQNAQSKGVIEKSVLSSSCWFMSLL